MVVSIPAVASLGHPSGAGYMFFCDELFFHAKQAKVTKKYSHAQALPQVVLGTLFELSQ